MGRRPILVVSFIWTFNLALTWGAVAQDSSLVGHWRLDETSGTIAADSSGNGHPGALQGAPQWVSGKVGGGLRFDGIDDYVDTGYTDNLTRWTVSAWVTSPAAPGNDFPSGPLHRQNNYQFNWNHNLDSFRGGVTLMVAGGWTPASFGTLGADRWYYLTGTYDGTSLKAYANGDLINTAAVSGTPDTENNTLKFGRQAFAALFFAGTIDDVRIYDRALAQEEIQTLMEGENPGLSSEPSPADRIADVARGVVLGWVPGKYAKTHDVYFGTVMDDVKAASRTDTKGVLVSPGQDSALYDPTGFLEFGRTYYWRIDEINVPPDSTLYKGDTWSFTVETYAYPIRSIKATASSLNSGLTGPEKTIDGSGLDALDQHSVLGSEMWLSKKGLMPVWIQYEFDTSYRLYQMWVWNSNQAIELDIGFGAKDVTVEYSIDGNTWTVLGNVPEFAQATGEENYLPNTIVDWGGVLARYARLTLNTNWGDALSSGLAEVRFFYVPVKASGPNPVPGAAGVAVDGILSWRPGRQAARHELYIGTDPNALSQVGTTTQPGYGLSSAGVEYDRTYYWKVNEVNDTETPPIWEGDVWSFSTPGSLIVDDFESYDDTCKKIFWMWVDAYGHGGSEECGVAGAAGNGSGGSVGHSSAPYAEQTIVYEGKQSMPLGYDNPSVASFSEALRTFAVPQDWTQGGIKTLVLYFHGALDNAAGQLYVKINNTKVVYNGKPEALTLPLWKQWNIDLGVVGGDLRSVGSLTIGVSGGGGQGIVYIDDVRLYRSAPAVVEPVNPGVTNLSAYYAMEGDVKDGSGRGNNGTPVGDPIFMAAPAGFGQAILFDGVNDYVDLPIGSLVSTLTSVTLATRVQFDDTGPTGRERIFDFGTGTINYLYLSPRQGAANQMTFAITTATVAEKRFMAPRTLGPGWHHVAVVIDGAALNVKLYLDGIVVAGGSTQVLPKDLGKTSQNWLGRSQFTADGYFRGMLDEFRVYNRALSAAEIRYLAGDR